MRAEAWHCEFAWLGGDRAVADVLVQVKGERILSVTPGVSAPAGVVRLAGLTLPGLANAHSHAFQRMLRGRTQTGTGSFWTWRDQMYSLAAVLEPHTYFALARATFAEMVMAGITCVGEFHYLHHDRRGRRYKDANEMGAALIAAAGEAGLRITLLDTCYLHGGFGEPPGQVQLRFSDGNVYDWVRRVDALRKLVSPAARVGAAVHSVRAVDPDSIELVAAWSKMNRTPLHAHVSEQPAENEQCIKAYAMTPTQLLSKCAALGENFTAVHATHVTGNDVRLLGDSRCTVAFCPTTERDLADGIGPSVLLRNSGVTLSLGSDSHAVIDPLEEMRGLEMDARLLHLERGNHSTAQLLSAATESGHRSLGWDDAGRIEAGYLADLVTVRLDTVRAVGADATNVLDSVVFASIAADVHHVVCSGRVVVRDGVHFSMDMPGELLRSFEAIS